MKRFAALAAALCACARTSAPIGHVLLYIDTDAPLPRNAAGVQPLFDRVRVEIYPPGATSPCATCTSELDVDEPLLREPSASLEIVPKPDTSGTRVRIRLFHSSFVDASGEVIPDAALETVVALPTVGREGTTIATAVLRVENLGKPAGTIAAPIPATSGAPDGKLAGSWSGATRVPCAGPSNGQACIEGGAFWMGDPHLALTDENTPRLVVLSPYWIDIDEVTVAEFRAVAPPPLYRWSGNSTGDSGDDFCTYATTPNSAREALAMECVTWAEARDYCIAKGGALPTEAQLERAFGGNRYPWGLDTPDCSSAIFGRGGVGVTSLTDDECNLDHLYTAAGPRPALAGSIDVTREGVRNLAGNVAEWALDFYQPWNAPFWSQVVIYEDPVCGTATPLLEHPTRAGNWTSVPAELERSRRAPIPAARVSPTVGFRCARSAKP